MEENENNEVIELKPLFESDIEEFKEIPIEDTIDATDTEIVVVSDEIESPKINEEGE